MGSPMCVLGEHGFSNVGPSLHLKARIGVGYFLFLWLKCGGPSNSQTQFSFFLVEKWEKKLERLFFVVVIDIIKYKQFTRRIWQCLPQMDKFPL